MNLNLRASEQDWTRLRKHCAPSFRTGFQREVGAIGVIGECQTADRREFLIAKMVWPEPGDIKVSRRGALVFDASYIRRAHLFMRREGLTGLVTFHTHPYCDAHVDFSTYDDDQDSILIDNLTELEPRTKLLSIVLGKSSQCGRLWTRETAYALLNQLLVVGEAIAFHPLNGQPPSPPPTPAAAFDSALAVTGVGALGLLTKLKIAVVGASGTGSLLCELLVRAGCKHLLLIDDDIIEDRNLNRVLHAAQDDAHSRDTKIEVLRRSIERLGLGCQVDVHLGTILDKSTLLLLRDSDVVFGCVDKAYPRLLLSLFSQQYLRPYIDVGTEIGGDERGIVSLDARTSYVTPGRPCLKCTGIVTPRQLEFESKSYEERQRVVTLGYSDDLLLRQPATMDLNMRAASFGVVVLRHLLQPFLSQPLPLEIHENVMMYSTRAITEPRAANPECNVCRSNPHSGFGDCGPAIGLERKMVDAIVGPKRQVAKAGLR